MENRSHYLTNAVTPNKDVPNHELLKEGELKETRVISRNLRSPTSTVKKISAPQFKQMCGDFGIQPCTCYYPDHQDVVRFELNTDEITKNASYLNGTGPSSCKDLQSIGHNLAGFYMVRFKPNRTEAIHCNFNNQTLQNSNIRVESTTEYSSKRNEEGSSPSEMIQFCKGSLKGQPCTFLYPDYPDIPLFTDVRNSKPTVEPACCNDLKLIGHKLNGFYIIRLNPKKAKIVFCDFHLEIASEGVKMRRKRSAAQKKISEESINIKPICSNVGSRPCSCYYSKSFNGLQFEMGNDDTTRNAMGENGTGPATCDELERIGYTLDGFYMLRFNAKTIKISYCKFDERVRLSKKKEKESNELSTFTPKSSTFFGNQPFAIISIVKLKFDTICHS